MKASFQKKALYVGITAAILGGSAAANAKDWSGAYVGGSIGGGTFTGSGSDRYGEFTEKSPGTIYGLDAGYNHQNGTTVMGVEFNYNQGNMSSAGMDNYGGCYHTEASWDWYTTLRGRIGLAADNTLVYVAGGYAWADTTYGYCYYSYCSNNSGNARAGGTKGGMTYAVGVESMFNDHVILRAEYETVELETTDANRVNGEPLKFNSSEKVLRVGANYKF